MSINAILVNSGLAGALSLGLATAYSFDPTQEQVLISSPSYIVDDIDLGRYNDCTTDCTATLLTADKQYQIEVVFDYKTADYSNGYQTFYAPEVDHLKSLEIYRYDDESKVKDGLDQYEIGKIKDAIATEILEKRA